ncbi:MAG TPA: flagellar biosynthetic protein FliO [Candidatus Baltobacteraceae bacterium]|jgi:flagellar biogenesis protein FliO
MSSGFLGHYILMLLVVAVMLAGLYMVARALGRGRLIASTGKRLVSVVESTYVSQNTTLHVIKVANSYFLVGGGAGHLQTLAEIPAENVEPWLTEQRNLFTTQTQSFAALWRNLRKPQQ